jgi:hypothetical protein
MRETDSRELLHRQFAHGQPYEDYKSTMRENRDIITAVEREVRLDAACLEALTALPGPIRALAIVEDWCRDSVDNLPILARLAEASGKLDLHVFSKDQHPDLMALYLKEGKYESLPVFAFLDGDFNELGRFIERPDSVTELRARLKREHGAPPAPLSQLAEDQRAPVRQMIEDIRVETRPFATAEVQRELRPIFTRALR